MKVKENLSPGTICYVDSNGCNPNFFAVIIDRKFWLKAARMERVLMPQLINEAKQDQYYMFRVLGIQAFRQYWRANDPEEIEPSPYVVMHYRYQAYNYVDRFDLLSIIEQSKIQGNRAGRLLFSENCEGYIKSALGDAEVVYEYLARKRLIPKDSGSFVQSKEKLLRLLEKAIPL